MPDAELNRAAIVAEMKRIEGESRADATVEGGTPEQVERATEAIRAVFASHGVTALEAEEGWQAEEIWDDSGFAPDMEPTDELGEGATAWLDAILAGTHAAFGPDAPCVYPGGRIGISVCYAYEEYELLKDRLLPDRVRERQEEAAGVDAALRAHGIDPDDLPPLPF